MWVFVITSNNIFIVRCMGGHVIAERISNRQIIMQQVRCYSRVLVCIYIYVYTYVCKKSKLSIVDLKFNCTADCALFCLLYPFSGVFCIPYSQRVKLNRW